MFSGYEYAKRSYPIKENVKYLLRMEKRYQNKAEEIRIKAIRLLKENRDLKLADVAKLLGRSDRTLQRWWQAYKQEGLQKVMQLKPRGGRRPIRIGEKGLEELNQKLQEESFSNLKEIQMFLKERYGVDYSISQVWYLVRLKLKAELKTSRSKRQNKTSKST